MPDAEPGVVPGSGDIFGTADGIDGTGAGAGRGLGAGFSSSLILSEANCGVLPDFLAASIRWRMVGLFTQYRIAASSEI